MKYTFPVLLLLMVLSISCLANSGGSNRDSLPLFTPDNPRFQYNGRIDFSVPRNPRYWMPGVSVRARFSGTVCKLLLDDEMRDSATHNYIEITLDDDPPLRMKLAARHNEIELRGNTRHNEHTVTITKDTEAGIGWLEFAGLRCRQLLQLPSMSSRKIECIGNSITCGTGSDQSAVPCGKGRWEDQHNAYLSYGVITARALHAACHLSAVSGIGLVHSCCQLGITMPEVFDKVNMRADSIKWDFSKYTPDVVTICLGQNDGVQDSSYFCSRYVAFIKTIRLQYPSATIICLSSPMADPGLLAVMQSNLGAVVEELNKTGDKKVYRYFFSRRYYHGCDTHPDLAEHRAIAAELTNYIRQVMRW